MPTLEQLFSSFDRTAFRCEGLSQYKVNDLGETILLEAYERGDQVRPEPTGEWGEWIAMLKAWKMEGKSVQRLRIIPSKPTVYVNCEIDWAFPVNEMAGEEILLISEDDVRRMLGQIPPDFWLFDSKNVAVLDYSPEGEWIGARVLNGKVEEYRRVCKTLLPGATPLSIYLRNRSSPRND